MVNLGLTWGQPRVNLGLTWGQPGVNLHRPTAAVAVLNDSAQVDLPSSGLGNTTVENSGSGCMGASGI